MRSLRSSPTLAINELSQRLVREGRSIFKLGLGQSPFPVPPLVVAALRSHAAEKDYLPVRGLPALRAAVAEHHRRLQGLHVSADDVIVGPGSKELMFLTQLVLDAHLFVPAPSWVSYVPQAQLAGRRATWIPTSAEHDWQLMPDELAAALARGPSGPRLLILNSPNNPSGYRIEAGTLEGLAAVARAHGVIVIADEIYALLDHAAEWPSLATFYPEGTIVSSGLSKWCGAGGWRLGTFAVAPQLRWLLDALAVAASETFTAVSAPVQHAAVAAFTGAPAIDAYLRDCRRILSALGRHCAALLRRSGARLADPHGGFYLFPDFTPLARTLRERGIAGGAALCSRLLDETGVATLPGSAFGRPEEEFTLRLSYVDFDGAAALAALGPADPGADFLKQYCGRVLAGVTVLADWVLRD